MTDLKRDHLELSDSPGTIASEAAINGLTPAELTTDQEDELEELIDLAIKIVGDPGLVLEQLQARIVRRQEWGPESNTGSMRERHLPLSSPTSSSGGAMPTQSPASVKVRRAFVGYDREIEAYQRSKSDLLEHAEGRYVVIVGDEMIGPFESRSEAEGAGYARFGLGPLYIKRVLADEQATEVTRFVTR